MIQITFDVIVCPDVCLENAPIPGLPNSTANPVGVHVGHQLLKFLGCGSDCKSVKCWLDVGRW